MKKIISLILVSIFICMLLAGCDWFYAENTTQYSENVTYNDIEYLRHDFYNFNIVFLEEHSKYIGDFIETYANGNQFPWEVFVLNDEANVLFSHHAVWLKPGYTLPDEYNEEFVSAEYVVSSGILDEYKEEVTPLITFEGAVTLGDIIEAEVSDIEGYTVHDEIRFRYKNHADIAVLLTVCSLDDQYYLNVAVDGTGDIELFKIKADYVEVLTSAIQEKEPAENN